MLFHITSLFYPKFLIEICLRRKVSAKGSALGPLQTKLYVTYSQAFDCLKFEKDFRKMWPIKIEKLSE